MNPAPDVYRLTEVCLVCHGDAGYPALLARRQSARARLGARIRDADSWHVEPIMTRPMLSVLMRGIRLNLSLRAHWDGDVAVIGGGSAGACADRRLAPDRRGLYAVGAFDSVGGHDWTWAEITPPWPGAYVDAHAIVGLLSAPVPNTWPIANQIRARARIDELALAAQGDR